MSFNRNKFFSVYSGSTPVGSPEYYEKKVVFSPDGNMSLETGKLRNRQVELNSYKDSCDVNKIIQRYENGDQTALLRDNTGAYCDLSVLPKDIHAAKKLSRDVESLYNSMGDDVKLKFGTLEEFISAFSSKDKFNDFLSVFKERDNVVAKAKEVSADA